FYFFFQAEDGIRAFHVTGVQTCALPIFNVDVNNRLTLSVSPGSSLEVRGEPGVSGSSTVQVFGPLLLTMPVLGGNSITNGSVFKIGRASCRDSIEIGGLFVPGSRKAL